MANSIPRMSNQFRKQFKLDNKYVKNWFPGHMVKGIKKINKMLHKIDCIIEVHDARVPFTGRNTKFQKQLSETRPHYLILNKVDLCDKSLNEKIEKQIKEQEKIEQILFTNLKTNNQIRQILPEVLKMVRNSERYQRTDSAEINLLVTGIPNVGKSSFINQILNLYVKGKGAVAKKGALPGVTRAVQEKVKLSTNPLVYIYDTPGILEPKFENPTIEPLKLAACDLLSVNQIGLEIIADYLLFWFNKYGHFNYVEKLNLDEPIDDVDEFLTKVCIKNNIFISRIDPATKQPKLVPNFEIASMKFIKLFQKGQLGNYTLDVDLIYG